jgi:hypothetical protein
MSTFDNKGHVQIHVDGKAMHGRWKIDESNSLITVTADDGRTASAQHEKVPSDFAARSLLKDIARSGR